LWSVKRYDDLGSVTGVTNDVDDVVAPFRHDVFGVVRVSSGRRISHRLFRISPSRFEHETLSPGS